MDVLQPHRGYARAAVLGKQPASRRVLFRRLLVTCKVGRASSDHVRARSKVHAVQDPAGMLSDGLRSRHVPLAQRDLGLSDQKYWSLRAQLSGLLKPSLHRRYPACRKQFAERVGEGVRKGRVERDLPKKLQAVVPPSSLSQPLKQLPREVVCFLGIGTFEA